MSLCFLESVTGILLLRKKIKANSHICNSYRKEIKSGRNMMLGRLLVSTFQEGTQKTIEERRKKVYFYTVMLIIQHDPNQDYSA